MSNPDDTLSLEEIEKLLEIAKTAKFAFVRAPDTDNGVQRLIITPDGQNVAWCGHESPEIAETLAAYIAAISPVVMQSLATEMIAMKQEIANAWENWSCVIEPVTNTLILLDALKLNHDGGPKESGQNLTDSIVALHNRAVEAEKATESLKDALEKEKTERDRLQTILDGRPLIDSALTENYLRWSQAINSDELDRSILAAKNANLLEDETPVDAKLVEQIARDLCIAAGNDPDELIDHPASKSWEPPSMPCWEQYAYDVPTMLASLRPGNILPGSAKTGQLIVTPLEATEEMLVNAGATPAGGVMPRGGVDRLRKWLPIYYRAMLSACRRDPI